MLVLMPSAPPRPGVHGLGPWELCLVSCTFKVRRKASAAASGERPISVSPDGLDAVSRQGADLSRLSPGPDGTSRSATDAPGAPRSCHRRRDHPDRRAGRSACRRRRADFRRQEPTSSPRAWAYARHPRAPRALESRRRRRGARWPPGQGGTSPNGWSTRAIFQSMMPVGRTTISQQLTIVNVAVDQDRGASWAALASRSAHTGARPGRPRRSAASAAAAALATGSRARRSQR